ncbi:hypothetical protein Pmani_018108 [Petrolisthes manimaculis]|uniref:Uncharacterized protein n=1 Tax=Petrolisthes manimaculis TaxID=1843537 RepID=A0AAE1PN15_9EUCA|nr:hypothetical protein Pmani_018108 [Petrolisthes manimaculis]
MLKSKEDLFEQERDAIAAMLRGSHAFVEAKTYAQTQLYFRYKVYDSYVVNERLYSTFAFWYFPKYTPWKFLFDKGIQRLVEGGFIDYWLKVQTYCYNLVYKPRTDNGLLNPGTPTGLRLVGTVNGTQLLLVREGFLRCDAVELHVDLEAVGLDIDLDAVGLDVDLDAVGLDVDLDAVGLDVDLDAVGLDIDLDAVYMATTVPYVGVGWEMR